jgi:hypothetical protein
LHPDYALFSKPNTPIATIEARDNEHSTGVAIVGELYTPRAVTHLMADIVNPQLCERVMWLRKTTRNMEKHLYKSIGY